MLKIKRILPIFRIFKIKSLMLRSLILSACIGLMTIKTAENKLDTISHTWRWVGVKTHKGDYKPVFTEKDEVMTLHPDGTYEKLLYGQLKMTGNWGFSPDSLKLSFAFASPPQKVYYNDSIILLTADTLVIGHLMWFGPEKEYGHDDWYYVRVPSN